MVASSFCNNTLDCLITAPADVGGTHMTRGVVPVVIILTLPLLAALSPRNYAEIDGINHFLPVKNDGDKNWNRYKKINLSCYRTRSKSVTRKHSVSLFSVDRCHPNGINNS